MIKKLAESTRTARIGKLRLGKKVNGRPVATDYFIVDAPNVDAVHEKYGDEPKELPVYLPEELNEAMWSAHYKLYGSTGVRCKGDGEVGHYYEDGELKSRDCADRGCPFAQDTVDDNGKTKKAQCGPKGLLAVKIVGIPTVGIYHIHVNGMNNISHVNGFLHSLENLAGTVKGIPFNITLEEEQAGKFKVIRIKLRESPETHKAVAGELREDDGLGSGLETFADLAVMSEDGEHICDLSIPEGEEHEARYNLATAIHDAIKKGIVVGTMKTSVEDILLKLNSTTEEEAASRLQQFKAWVEKYKETRKKPVKDFKEDHNNAKYVYTNLADADFETLGLKRPESWEELSREIVRAGTKLIEEKREAVAA